MNQAMYLMKKGVQCKALWITTGAVLGLTAIGVGAALVWNSRQVRTARTVKRAEKILYQVGTAMRNVSGITED